MKKFCSYFLVLIFSIIPVFLHAQLSVSYQAFSPDDIVVEIGQWKITAKELEKYEIEPLKVVMANDGDTDEVCVPDRQCLLPDNLYKRFKCSTGISWLKGCGGILAYFCFLSFVSLPIMFPEELQKMRKELRKMNNSQWSSAQKIQYSFNMGMGTSHISPIKVCFFNGSLLVGSVLIAWYFIRSAVVANQRLISYLRLNLFFEECQIPAHTSTTRLMFVAKEQDKK